MPSFDSAGIMDANRYLGRYQRCSESFMSEGEVEGEGEVTSFLPRRTCPSRSPRAPPSCSACCYHSHHPADFYLETFAELSHFHSSHHLPRSIKITFSLSPKPIPPSPNSSLILSFYTFASVSIYQKSHRSSPIPRLVPLGFCHRVTHPRLSLLRPLTLHAHVATDIHPSHQQDEIAGFRSSGWPRCHCPVWSR